MGPDICTRGALAWLVVADFGAVSAVTQRFGTQPYVSLALRVSVAARVAVAMSVAVAIAVAVTVAVSVVIVVVY
eukprot:3252576-Lingulodinium_polyedra.AAC.1